MRLNSKFTQWDNKSNGAVCLPVDRLNPAMSSVTKHTQNTTPDPTKLALNN